MKAVNAKEIYNIATETMANAPLKIICGILLSAYSFLFDSTKTELYLAVVVLIIFDFITALSATINTKEKITSARASRTLGKLVVYGILVSASVLADRFIIDSVQIFADLMLAFVAITELISIIENVGKMGYEIPLNLLKHLKKVKNKK